MKPTLTIPEAAKRIPIGTSTLRRYIRRKQITVIVLPGGDQRIDMSTNPQRTNVEVLQCSQELAEAICRLITVCLPKKDLPEA